ncbi:hypothetical protein CONPUDRAFT_76750 [Coniophora puteana RWD-64-598 SS2]|uniref:Uncharacterized protein n=1 Tax=Coniophora puteana (strain RWD-64-598) TaxID=741705 RepID=A0A5M3MBE7_CONPW|nr:uncharacterized protein CONPUDRAFT_76750 [Coniophora puteana RWD-64-598 SS2]EIW76403.1 hypothetical protein CONPUDRAFT_76750 [Coniophora puteana RWD-64-598 SS2]
MTSSLTPLEQAEQFAYGFTIVVYAFLLDIGREVTTFRQTTLGIRVTVIIHRSGRFDLAALRRYSLGNLSHVDANLRPKFKNLSKPLVPAWTDSILVFIITFLLQGMIAMMAVRVCILLGKPRKLMITLAVGFFIGQSARLFAIIYNMTLMSTGRTQVSWFDPVADGSILIFELALCILVLYYVFLRFRERRRPGIKVYNDSKQTLSSFLCIVQLISTDVNPAPFPTPALARPGFPRYIFLVL